ncbi:hypothetical protein Q5Y75_17475 [Ruegeria sp. 2205SS24-7]|uniref:hypothetical protein n=1 Tax=Ruegeria discodermiae TaxID=3064389 RepID=UPI002741251C|nr:hypothetical protein [Ruegeria sp. 2205SS24-7]MDP5219013.1 hypothetical protein [Ruegeria sp. 2205SS24-7]
MSIQPENKDKRGGKLTPGEYDSLEIYHLRDQACRWPRSDERQHHFFQYSAVTRIMLAASRPANVAVSSDDIRFLLLAENS